MNLQHLSLVTATPAATPAEAWRHFADKLAFYTDPADVRVDLDSGKAPFTLLDVRSREAFAQGHIPGAISLPHAEITEETTASFAKDRLLVTYCWSPACNGATKGALRLAALGFNVKEMFGGIEYWKKEGGPVEAA